MCLSLNNLPDWLANRGCGVLLHPSSLPGKYGIGNLGNQAREWIDFLCDAGYSYWQTCPVGPTGFGDSPYQVFSSSAGNPYFIDWDPLISAGYLYQEDLISLQSLSPARIDFADLYRNFFPILRNAFKKFSQNPFLIEKTYGKISAFEEKNSHWLSSFASFQTLKFRNELKPWWEWPEIERNPKLDHNFTKDELDEYNFQIFTQYLFRSQWLKLRAYASSKGISIIGDLPIYVAPDSADVWSNRDLFKIKPDGSFQSVAGVPPDYFNATGQLWGNPLYDWKNLEAMNYFWWTQRIQDQLEMFDVIRIDHFRAFHDFWSVPVTSKDAGSGKWELGPGIKFWKQIKESFPKLPFLAEDLGDIDQEVRKLRIDAGLPGMAVLQFAFDGNPKNLYLPHHLTHDLVLYTGTHDNDTSLGWYHGTSEEIRSYFRCYFNVDGSVPGWDMLRHAYRSVSQLVIIPAQDLLSLGSDARFNIPGEPTGNWSWRMTSSQFEKLKYESTDYLYEQALLTDRFKPSKKS